jgi:hypothetical protein
MTPVLLAGVGGATVCVGVFVTFVMNQIEPQSSITARVAMQAFGLVVICNGLQLVVVARQESDRK